MMNKILFLTLFIFLTLWEYQIGIISKEHFQVNVHDALIQKKQEIKPSLFIDEVYDLTYLHLFYDKNQIKIGKNKLNLLLCSQDYCTKQEVFLEIVENDDSPPELKGIKDRVILAGDSLDLKKGISIEDNYDQNPIFTMDIKDLDTQTPGLYEVLYTTKDCFNNTRTYQQKITVLDKYDSIPIIPDGKKVVYLTFDDGPSINTKEVLRILEKYQAKATFFVTGMYPEYRFLIKEAYKQGHQIGLHTYIHDYENVYRSTTHYFKDLERIGEIVREEIGFTPKIIRFPGGSSNQVSKLYTPRIMTRLVKMVRDQGYQYYDWNSDIGDGVLKKEASLYFEYFKASIGDKDKVVLLLHDGHGNSETVKVLPQILEYLQKNGYQFETINEETPTFHHSVAN